MKKNLTVCFFENPGALAEIKQWESLKFNQISNKFVDGDDTRIYWLQLDSEKCDGYEMEVLYCIPMYNIPNDNKSFIVSVLGGLDAKIGEIIKIHKLHYYKTIVFGKVSISWLKIISTLVEKLLHRKI